MIAAWIGSDKIVDELLEVKDINVMEKNRVSLSMGRSS